MSGVSRSPGADTLRQLYIEEGRTAEGIAALYGVTGWTARRWLSEAGIRRKTPEYYTAQEKEKETIRRLYVDEGLSARELAEAMGISKDKAVAKLYRYGIKKPLREPATEGMLRRMYLNEGLTAEEIARRTGFATGTIRVYLTQYGIKRGPANGRGGYRECVRPEKEELERLAAEGLHITEIARRYGVAKNTASQWVKKYGISIRRGSRNPGREALKGMLASGMSTKQIAGKYGVTRKTVGEWLRKEGIQAKRGRPPKNEPKRL